MKFHIYKITNRVNGKVYIGYAKGDPERRWFDHRKYCCKSFPDFPLYRAFARYGPDNFDFTVIASTEDEDEALNVLEPKFIREYRSNERDLGYNQTAGGDGLRTPSAEVRAKMAAAKIGKRGNNTGKKWSPELKAQRRYVWDALADFNRGRKRKPGTGANISAALKAAPLKWRGEKQDPELIAKRVKSCLSSSKRPYYWAEGSDGETYYIFRSLSTFAREHGMTRTNISRTLVENRGWRVKGFLFRKLSSL